MIYFVTARQIGMVKIGFSRLPSSRISKMQTDSPFPLEFEREMNGTRESEALLHRVFAESRRHGEWFVLCERIEAFMSGLTIPNQTRKARRIEFYASGEDSDIIRQRGGIRPVARKLGHRNHTTVQGWVERNRIPPAHRDAVLALSDGDAA